MKLSLEGMWNLELSENLPIEYTKRIQLPGILQEAGYGDDINEHTPWVSSLHDRLWYQREEYKVEEKILVPFLSQPPKHYLGKAWYQRSFYIPKGNKETEFHLFIEGVKWRTKVFIDDKYIDSYEGLCTPHTFNLGYLEEGEHSLSICVDNSLLYPYRPDGHMVSDALGATWNGMVGEIYIEGVQSIYLKHIKVFPMVSNRSVESKIEVVNHKDTSRKVFLLINNEEREVTLHSGNNIISHIVSFPEDAKTWDAANPNLHQIIVVLRYDDFEEERVIPFGFCNAKVQDGLFYINDKVTYFRGTHFGGDFPLTGYPSFKIEDWERIFRICKSWGLNYIRFHSFCPPRAAFHAADHVGIYLQIECGMWNTFNEGNGMDEILWEETRKILDAFGNHPSFVMLSPSNEPGGEWFEPLSKWVSRCREYDNRRLYTAQSGWFYPMEPEKIHGTDYVYFHRSGYGIKPGGTIRNSQGWNGKDYRLSLEGIKYPVISHELGQWCSYPDFDVIDKFTGYLIPSNYMVFKESARRNGVLEQSKKFAYLSGKVKALFYKEEIEANLRTPHIYGFELLDLHDYIGQGTALVGLLDPFWEEKGFLTKEEFTRYCNETVPLLRIPKYTYKKDESIDCPLELCHFGQEEIKDAVVYWEVISDENKVIKGGEFSLDLIPLGKNIIIGTISFSLNDLNAPASYEIRVGIKDTNIYNSWRIWVYEEYKEASKLLAKALYDNDFLALTKDVIFTTSFTKALSFLDLGKRVIYNPKKEDHRLDSPPLNFKTSFWNSYMGPTYIRGMGMVIDKEHKALSLFPTMEYADWQWSEVMNGAYGLNLDKFPKELKPIVQPIDDWNRNYKLAMILECKVSSGSLLLVTADFKNLDTRPEALQLLNSLITYASSKDFNPKAVVSKETLYDSFFPRNIMTSKGVEVEEEFKNILDGNPNTIYVKEDAYPLSIHMTSRQELYIKGMIYMPRQNQREHAGEIKGIKIEAIIGNEYMTVYEGELSSSFHPKEILFYQPIKTKDVRFTALYGYSGKDIPMYVEDSYGWHFVKQDYEDKSVSIADLLFIPVHKEFDSSDMIVENEGASIVVKSTTKEIDYE